jgi:hypothetical protein
VPDDDWRNRHPRGRKAEQILPIPRVEEALRVEAIEIFTKIAALAADHEVARMNLRPNRESQEFRARQADIAAKALSEMVEIYQKLPALMEKELGFALLRRDEGPGDN